MTRTQRKNLKKLRDYLSGPLHEGSEFNMSTFSDSTHVLSATECGSIGCAVGHGPYAGIKKRPDELWTQYAIRVFGAGFNKKTTIEECYNWHWLFDASWAKCFPTKDDAVKRIDALLQYGSVQKLVDRQYELDAYTLKMVEAAEKTFEKDEFPKRTQDISGDYE